MQVSVQLDSETFIWVCQELNELADSVVTGEVENSDFWGEKMEVAYANKLWGISSAIEKQVVAHLGGAKVLTQASSSVIHS